MPYADVRGQRLFYREEIPPTPGEPAVIWSHGLFMDHSMFDPQLDALGASYRCVAWDERGHGQTESGMDSFSYWDSAQDLLGLMDELGIEKAVLAGMSQGGFLSLRAALTAPERVLGLILIDTQAGVEDPTKLEGYNQLLDAWCSGDAGKGLPQEVSDTVAAIILGGYERAGEWQERWQQMDHRKVRQVYDTLTSREDIHDRLGEIQAPALVLHARDDAAIETGQAQALADGLPNAELVLLDSGGHAANLTRPEEANRHFERFLSSLPTDAAA